jgi:hypothetical protein
MQIVLQIVNKFLAFYGTRKSITIFTTARLFSLFSPRSFQSTSSHPSPLRSTLILSFHLRQGLSNGLSFRFHNQTPTCIYLLSLRAACPAYLVLLDFVTWMICTERYKLRSSSLCNLLHSRVTSSLLGPNIFFSTLFSKLSTYVLPSLWQTQFHTHIK